MTNVEDYDDADVQIFERLRVHESLVDIMIEMTEVKDIVESLQEYRFKYFRESGNDRPQRGALCAQGVRQIGIEDRMGKVMRIVALLFQHLRPEDEEVVLFATRVRQVEAFVESVRNQLIEATGIRGETDRYERAVTQWRIGVERQDTGTKRLDVVKAEVRRLEKGVDDQEQIQRCARLE